jgi:hypothetical protein
MGAARQVCGQLSAMVCIGGLMPTSESVINEAFVRNMNTVALFEGHGVLFCIDWVIRL